MIFLFEVRKSIEKSVHLIKTQFINFIHGASGDVSIHFVFKTKWSWRSVVKIKKTKR